MYSFSSCITSRWHHSYDNQSNSHPHWGHGEHHLRPTSHAGPHGRQVGRRYFQSRSLRHTHTADASATVAVGTAADVHHYTCYVSMFQPALYLNDLDVISWKLLGLAHQTVTCLCVFSHAQKEVLCFINALYLRVLADIMLALQVKQSVIIWLISGACGARSSKLHAQ